MIFMGVVTFMGRTAVTNNKTVGQLQPVRKTKPRGKANAVGIFFDVWNFRIFRDF